MENCILNTIGSNYRVTLIGSSHGNLVGVIIDGFPVGIELNLEEIQLWLTRRRPGQSKITTPRDEQDKLIISTGIFNNATSGEPIFAYVENSNKDSSYYEKIKEIPRPGHADYPAYIKYKGSNDYRGGGRFSGRMTIGIVIAGAIARQLLEKYGIKIYGYTKSIGTKSIDESTLTMKLEKYETYENISRVPLSTDSKAIEDLISETRKKGDSLGGIVECIVNNLPVGVGEPFFDSLESRISSMIFSIPAVKGIEFGSGFNASKLKGSEHNDRYKFYKELNEFKTLTNNAGGILGGLSNGMPLVFRVAFKPTSSISIPQDTANFVSKEETKLIIKGRHDPCIVPRAVPVVENAVASVILDLMLQGHFIKEKKFEGF
ncbi:MAG: Chorismate synthase [Candidatus Heimdallarchaeota archaeon LC_3]|nr:MAG: Chorismate synthase [Candidatus Heimdallarchaeota archaeon LC_3]